MNILELALKRVVEHGMLQVDGLSMLEGFAKGEGADIPWEVVALKLPKEIADRIDKAGTGWMLMHRPSLTLLDVKRDGKMLATGEIL